MDNIINILQNLEKTISVLANIVLIIYSLYSTIRAKRWKQTSQYLSSVVGQYSKGTIKGDSITHNSSIMSNTIRFAPKKIKKYVGKVIKKNF